MPTTNELGCDPGTNDCESNTLATTLAWLILNSSSNINTLWYSTRIDRWVLYATDQLCTSWTIPRPDETSPWAGEDNALYLGEFCVMATTSN